MLNKYDKFGTPWLMSLRQTNLNLNEIVRFQTHGMPKGNSCNLLKYEKTISPTIQPPPANRAPHVLSGVVAFHLGST